jgi:hypothetical protein
MARPLRIEFEDALYHLCARGNARQPVFRDERDCDRFLKKGERGQKKGERGQSYLSTVPEIFLSSRQPILYR